MVVIGGILDSSSTAALLKSCLTHQCANRYYSSHQSDDRTSISLSKIVFAMGPGNAPAVQVRKAKMDRFGTRTIQKPDLLLRSGPILDPYPSTNVFCWVVVDPSVPIFGSGYRVFYLWSHSDILLLITKYWCWYVIVFFGRIGCLYNQQQELYVPCLILKKEKVSRSLHDSENEHPQSVKNVWSWKSGN